ncbi:MAG: response regulator transcription factor [Acidimicrobiales bacterium]
MAPMLQLDSGAITGRALGDLIRPDDVEGLRLHADALCDAPTRTWVPVHLARDEGGSARFCFSLSRAPEEVAAFAFVITRQGGDVRPFAQGTQGAQAAQQTDHRVARFEQTLERISAEIDKVLPLHRAEPLIPSDVLNLLRGASPRQLEVVRRVGAGQRVSSIARDMYLSPSTVRNHLSAIFRRLGVRSQAELVELLTTTRQHGKGERAPWEVEAVDR